MLFKQSITFAVGVSYRPYEHPDAAGNVTVEKGHGNVDGIWLKNKVVAKLFVKHFLLNSSLETSVKFFDVGTGRNFREEIPADCIRLVYSGKPRFIGVVFQNVPICVKLYGSKRMMVELLFRHLVRVDTLISQTYWIG